MIKGFELKVRRNESVTVTAIYPAWELPVMEAVHPETTVVREVEIDRAAPVAEEEYTRLENRYRQSTNEDGSKGLPFVAAVYGQYQNGIRELQKAIDASVIEQVSTPVDADSLLGTAA